MKSLTLLWKQLAHDCANRCCTSTINLHDEVELDFKTLIERSKNEGESFLTISLPSFGKDFQKSLDQGIVARDMFQGFKTLSHGYLPVFLRGFTELVFDRYNGVILANPDIDAIHAVRQLTLIFGKMHLPCSDTRERAAMSSFVQCESEVKQSDARMESSDYEDFERVSGLLFRSMFSKIDKTIYDGDHVPKHGPGATADKLLGNKKYQLRSWTSRLERYFPSCDFLFANARYFNEHYDDLDYREPETEIPVKVITVPKTQKTPRIIAIEPACMQYAQQSVQEQFYTEVDKCYLSSFIGFLDQTPNQRMAEIGSRTGSLATLDLSEASDRVSNQLVRRMFSNWPHLREAIEDCRSRRADVPGYGVIRLAKFASMGSALCFPIEAMVFLTLCFIGIERARDHRFSRKSEILEYSGSVRIFGDDIIVPVDCVHSVIHTLESFGTRVGMSKSFWIGKFRESCGKEYYDGHDVSIVKVRRKFPTTRKHVPEVVSLVSLRNQLYFAGMWGTVKWLDQRIGKILKYFPRVAPSSSVLGRNSFLGYDTEKMCEHLHAPLVKGYVIVAKPPRDPLDGDGALLKFFLKRSGLPSADRKHLERAGRPRAVNIKPRFSSPF